MRLLFIYLFIYLFIDSKENRTNVHPAGNLSHFMSTGKEALNRPFATSDHVVENPPCWRASSLLFPHWDIKTNASQASLVQVSLFYCPSAGIIMSLPSSMADFVPRDVYSIFTNLKTNNIKHIKFV